MGTFPQVSDLPFACNDTLEIGQVYRLKFFLPNSVCCLDSCYIITHLISTFWFFANLQGHKASPLVFYAFMVLEFLLKAYVLVFFVSVRKGFFHCDIFFLDMPVDSFWLKNGFYRSMLPSQ